MNETRIHALSCLKSQGRLPRHACLNDIVKRALTSANIPSTLEPKGLCRGDGRRPDDWYVYPSFLGFKGDAWCGMLRVMTCLPPLTFPFPVQVQAALLTELP